MPRLLVIAATMLAVTLAGFELVPRVAPVDTVAGEQRLGFFAWTRTDPVLGQANVAGFRAPERGIAIDSLGFRGPEVTRVKPPGVVRIACLGDSTTFGMSRAQALELWTDTSYPAELERLAREDGLRVEVINAGVLGYTSSEGLVQLFSQILPLEPDVITLRFGSTDHGVALRGDLTPLGARLEYPVVRLLPAVAWRSEAVRSFFRLYRRDIALRRRWVQPRRVTPERFEENLRRFVAVGRERGVHVAFVDYPYREIERGLSPGEKLPSVYQSARTIEELYAIHDAYQQVVARVAADTGTPFVRTLDALRGASAPTFGDYDMAHPNAAGYATIATRLYEHLRQLRWLEGPQREPNG